MTQGTVDIRLDAARLEALKTALACLPEHVREAAGISAETYDQLRAELDDASNPRLTVVGCGATAYTLETPSDDGPRVEIFGSECQRDEAFDELTGPDGPYVEGDVACGQQDIRLEAAETDRAPAHLIAAARRMHHVNDKIEIDDLAYASGNASGKWVSAWVWVPGQTIRQSKALRHHA